MTKKNYAFASFFTGLSILLVAIFCIYKDFFEVRIGPIGSGERPLRSYFIYTIAIAVGFYQCAVGVFVYIRNKSEVE